MSNKNFIKGQTVEADIAEAVDFLYEEKIAKGKKPANKKAFGSLVSAVKSAKASITIDFEEDTFEIVYEEVEETVEETQPVENTTTSNGDDLPF